MGACPAVPPQGVDPPATGLLCQLLCFGCFVQISVTPPTHYPQKSHAEYSVAFKKMHGYKIMFAVSIVVSLGIGKIATQLSLHIYRQRKSLSIQMAPSRNSQMHTAQCKRGNVTSERRRDINFLTCQVPETKNTSGRENPSSSEEGKEAILSSLLLHPAGN